MWSASPRRRRIAINAIADRLQKDKASAVRLAKENFRQTGTAFAEVFLPPKVDHRFIRSNISFSDPDQFSRMENIQRPIVGTTGHFGAWELLAPIFSLSFSSRQRQIIVKHPKDLDFAALISHYRGFGGNRIVSHDQAAHLVLRCLRRNGISAFLVDHNTKRSKSTFLPFLGREASVNIGPAVLAVRSKALIWPIFLIRKGRGRYIFHSRSSLDTAELTGNMEEKVHAAALFYTRAVQDMVVRYPEQWFWMHQRWRTRPVEKKTLERA
jgi:KDO2-lipid IV(A) lauroyltransferase